MTARATQQINSGFGTFMPGEPLKGVPDDAVEAWIEAGIAARAPEPAAVIEAAAPAFGHLSGLNVPALLELATALKVDLPRRGTKAVLIAAIEARQAENAMAAATPDPSVTPTPDGLTTDRDPLESMVKRELLALAAELGIAFEGRPPTNAVVIEQIKAAQAAEASAVNDEARTSEGTGEPMEGIEVPLDGTFAEIASESGNGTETAELGEVVVKGSKGLTADG